MSLGACPSATMWRPSCKRRGCPVCGVRWARNTYTRSVVNLECTTLENRKGERRERGAAVAMIVVTPPGKERLPWDRERCRHKPDAKTPCSGPRGCKVQDRALREWCDTLSWRWAGLRKAARQAVIRAGFDAPPVLLERVWEPQKRGTPHLHLIVPYGTPRERNAAQQLAEELHRLAPRWDFGNVDRRLVAMEGREAARYLASYLTGRNAKKDSIRENIADPRLPQLLVWINPELTRVTLFTARTMRRARHIWAYLEGKCEPPAWTDRDEQVKANAVFARHYLKRGPPPLAVRLATGRREPRLWWLRAYNDQQVGSALESIARAEGVLAFA